MSTHEIWLRCPKCSWTWRALLLIDEPPERVQTFEQECVKAGCNKCEHEGPMELVQR